MKNKKRSARKILSGIGTAFWIIATAICIIVVCKVSFGAEPSIFGYRCFYIVSGSMEPNIPVHSAVFVHKQSSYKEGDVITFRSVDAQIYGQPNTHRIIEVTEKDGQTAFITQGDNNPEADSDPVLLDMVYGKVVLSTGKLEWVGQLFGFLTTPGGFVALIVIPILLIALISMKDFLKVQKQAVMDDMRKKLEEEYGNKSPENDPEKQDKEGKR